MSRSEYDIHVSRAARPDEEDGHTAVPTPTPVVAEEALRTALDTAAKLRTESVVIHAPVARALLTTLEKCYSTGYAHGKQAITSAILAWLDDGLDQGDHEFGWKSAVRANLPDAAALAEAPDPAPRLTRDDIMAMDEPTK